MKNYLNICIGVIIIVAVTTLAFQRRSIQAAVEEQQHLQDAKADLESKSSSTAASSNVSNEEMLTAEEKSELLRLRNQVRELRDQAKQVEELRAANERIVQETARLATGSPPARLAEMEGFVASQDWGEVGLANPEDSLRTFLGAIRTGNMDRFIQCLGPVQAEQWRLQLQQGDSGKMALEHLQKFLQVPGYRISKRTELGPDRVVLGMQVAAGGLVAEMVMQRYGAEWKMEEPFQMK